MSNDREHRSSPPAFNDHDENDDVKVDDEMFKSAALPPIVDDVPLSGDEDDENPFGEPSVEMKEETKQTESFMNNNSIKNTTTNNNAIQTAGEQPVIPMAGSESHSTYSIQKDQQFYSNDLSKKSIEINSSVTQPKSTLEHQSSFPKPMASETTDLKSNQIQSKEYDIEITVSDPTRVGEVCQ